MAFNCGRKCQSVCVYVYVRRVDVQEEHINQKNHCRLAVEKRTTGMRNDRTGHEDKKMKKKKM